MVEIIFRFGAKPATSQVTQKTHRRWHVPFWAGYLVISHQARRPKLPKTRTWRLPLGFGALELAYDLKPRHSKAIRTRQIHIPLWPQWLSRRTSHTKVAKSKRLAFSRSAVLTVALIMAGVAGLAYFGLRMVDAGTPLPVDQTSELPTPVLAPGERPVGLERSVPVSIDIPSVSIKTNLIELGRNPDGTLATPERFDIAGWYKYSPTPGEIGPAVIMGHVDSRNGPAVFWNLRYLKVGAVIKVRRHDGSLVKFEVNKVRQFYQNDFPTQEVYGDLDYAGLRLITCGGVFSHLTHRYNQNTVVYASIIK